MPYRKPYRRRGRKPVRRPMRKRPIYRKKRVGVFRPAVHRFKRTIQTILALNTTEAQSGWAYDGNAITRQWTFALSDLVNVNNTDFKNLFAAYRIKGVRMQGFSSNTMASDQNSNVILTYCNNWQGTTTALTQQYFDERQASKRRPLLNRQGGKAWDMYIPLRQLSNIFSGSVVSNDYGTMKPKWIGTNEDTTGHYGLNMRLERADGDAFGQYMQSGGFASIRIVLTYYLECRGVQ